MLTKMHAQSLFVALAFTTVAVYGASPNPDASRVDLDAVFKGLQLDFCNAKCAVALKAPLIDVLTGVDVYSNMDKLCNAYDQANDCAKKTFCIKNQVYTILTSGLEDLCKGDKKTYIKDNEQCIKPRFDDVSQKCDGNCHFVKAFADYSRDPSVRRSMSIFQMLDRLDGVCKSLNCYLPCLSNGLDNEKCPTAGGVITSGILKPFYIAADFVSKMAPNVQQLVASKLPQSCAPLINKDTLNNITGPVH